MNPTIAQIVRETAAQECCDADDLLNRSRRRDLCRLRERAWWACRRLRPDVSLPRLGMAFDRDHTTILSGVRAYERLRLTDPRERACSDLLVEMLEEDQCVPPISAIDRRLLEAALAGRGPGAAAVHAGLSLEAARDRLAAIVRQLRRQGFA